MLVTGHSYHKQTIRRNGVIMLIVCVLALLTALLIVHMKQLTDKMTPQPELRSQSIFIREPWTRSPAIWDAWGD